MRIALVFAIALFIVVVCIAFSYYFIYFLQIIARAKSCLKLELVSKTILRLAKV